MPEDNRPLADAGEEALLPLVRLGREAIVVGKRRAVHVEDAVELGSRRQVEEPFHLLGGNLVPEPPVRLAHLRPILGRLEQPALTVAADPRRVRQLAQTRECLERVRTRGPVVAAQQPAVDVHGLRVGEHRLERIQVAVDVVEDSEQALLVSRR